MTDFPPAYCTWLKPDGEFFTNPTEEHIDYLKIAAKHIEITAGNGNYIQAMEQFMQETKWIRMRTYPGSKQMAIHGVKPFTKDQRNTFKDLEIFGYTLLFNYGQMNPKLE